MTDIAWPQPYKQGRSVNVKLNSLFHQRKDFAEVPEQYLPYTAAEEWVCGYAIPPFQRPVVWSEDQMVKFIESAVLGLNLGSYTYNYLEREVGWMEIEPRTHFWLIDGQQRLTAFDRFWDDAFPVFGLKWSELPKLRQRQFLMDTAFPAAEVTLASEAELRDMYDRMNYGGTPHAEEYRASSGYTR